MDPVQITLRLLHVVVGAVWVGFVVFAATMLSPAVQEAGPDGARVLVALKRRGMLNILPVLALTTIVSGFWLFARASAGQHGAYEASRTGGAISMGAVLALVAFALGIGVLRPSMSRAIDLAETLGTTSTADRDQRMAELQRYRRRGMLANRVIAALLLLATGAMAVARYL